MRELVLLEEFTNCLPGRIATYVTERKVTSMSEAAVLADEYVLTHRDNFDKFPLFPERGVIAARTSTSKHQFKGEVTNDGKESADVTDGIVCFYCKKRGHMINQCFALNKKNSIPSKTVNLMKTQSVCSAQSSCGPEMIKSGLGIYAPFVMKGLVSLTEEGPRVPITILRDSAASQSVLL